MTIRRLLIPLLLLFSLTASRWSFDEKPTPPGREWPEYLGGPDRNHYAPLTQIDTTNVGRLAVAWQYHTGDSGQTQCNTIMVAGSLYGTTASNQVFALDAATGRERWRNTSMAGTLNTSRGVTYWADGADQRILFTAGPALCAVDARTGAFVPTFGQGGKASLKQGLGLSATDKYVISNTPGTVFGDLIIMPLRLSEEADAAPGHIQAFSVRTGKLAWTFHTIPQPGEFGYDTWPRQAYKNTDVGGANCWAGMAIDRQRGIVYVPTGSAAGDFYGGNRRGQNLFANCLLALDARTGKRRWHYQLVHHDLWDRDLPAPPNLVTIRQQGRTIDAVAQVTKSGHVFVFDRVSGKPLFPIQEKAVPGSIMPGEVAWPTQPLPTRPAPFTRQLLTEADINPYAENRDTLLAQFRRAKKGQFVPLSKTPTLLFPGADGGAEWGGAAVTPDGVLYVNANEMAWLFSLSNTPAADQLAHLSPGQRIYTTNCLSCHGPNRTGNPGSGYPSLVNLSSRRTRESTAALISNGKGMMPGFVRLSDTEKQALVSFLFGDEKVEGVAVASGAGRKKPHVPYQFNGYQKFLDSQGYPGISPPWGTLTAIDLNTGTHRWQIPLGERSELTARGIPPTGTENYGGPVVTAGGLLFIAATMDGKFRAFSQKTGQLLWETQLPAAGFATPSTYEVNGKQYVVVACGGTKLGTRKGDSFMAFALP